MRFAVGQRVVFIRKDPTETMPFGARGKIEEGDFGDKNVYMVHFEKHGYASVMENHIVHEREFITAPQAWPINESEVYDAVRFFNETVRFLEQYGWKPYDNGISAISFKNWTHPRHEKGISVYGTFEALKDEIEKHIREADLREEAMG